MLLFSRRVHNVAESLKILF